MGFTDYFGYGFIIPQEEYDEALAHFIHATEIHSKFQHQNTIFKFRLYNKFAFPYVWDVII